MKKINNYQISFDYLNQIYRANVLKVIYPNGDKVFQVDFSAAHYWLMYTAQGWETVADIKLCPALNAALIKAVMIFKTEDYSPVVENPLKINLLERSI